MPAGIYERPTYEVTCSVCGDLYTQRRKPIDTPRCKRCMKKAHDKKYKSQNKHKISAYMKTDKMKEYNRRYYEENKEAIQEKARIRGTEYYWKNRRTVLKKAELRPEGHVWDESGLFIRKIR